MSSTKHKPIATDLQLKKLMPEHKAYDVRIKNIPGLVVRVTPTGSKSFRWDRGSKHKPRIITYGNYPNLTLQEVRKLHEEKQQQHRAGTLGIADIKEPKNIRDLAELYYKNKKLTLKRPDAIRQIIDHDITPIIGEIKLNTVTTLVIRNTVDKVIQRGAKSHAGKVLSILKSMFNYAMANGVMSTNPALPITKDALGIVSTPRNRVLSSNELKLFWDALEANRSQSTRVALQLLILLGLRTGELRLSKWEHLDTDNKVLNIPVENQKISPKHLAKAKVFTVPLDSFSLGLFEKLRGLDSEYIFAGAKSNTPLGDKVLSRYTNRTLTRLKAEPFTPHDLRRTFRTGLSKLNIPPHIAERCLNHSLGKILETYDTHDFIEERRNAMSQWSDHIQEVIL